MVVGHFPLSNKICVVTGGGSGIGLAFVKLALQSGAKCLIADITLTPEVQTLLDQNPSSLHYTKCDVTHWPDLESLPSKIHASFGPTATADIWVPSAGIFEPKWSSWLHDTESDSYQTLRINVDHPLKLSRLAFRNLLRANKPGVIMLVSSLAGIRGNYACPLYIASKHAIVGFAKSLAPADKDENVRVVCVCPGVVDTPLWTGEDAKDVAAQYRFRVEGSVSAEEVARAMKEMIEDVEGKYPGGSLVAVAKGREREVLGEEMRKQSVDLEGEGMREYVEGLYGPVRGVFRAERGA